MFKKNKFLIVIVAIFFLYILINNVKIFSVYPGDCQFVYNEYFSQIKKGECVCIINYRENNWVVEKSSCSCLENKNVNIDFHFDPLELRMAHEEDFKDMAKYVILFEHYENQITILPEKIVITNYYYRNDGYDYLKIKDLTMVGKYKAILRLLNIE